MILMSATSDTKQLLYYFSEYYGHPYNTSKPPPLIEMSKNFNYNVSIFYLDDLYGRILSVSISYFLSVIYV